MQTKNMSETLSQNSVIFEYPFLSTIKKPQPELQQPDLTMHHLQLERENFQKVKLQQKIGISRSPTPENHNHFESYLAEDDINDDSSIEFYEEQEEIDQSIEREIQQLESEITYKLNEQYNLLQEKLKLKSKEKEKVLRTLRELSTIEPAFELGVVSSEQALQEKPFEENLKIQNIESSKGSINLPKRNSLNTKKIKDSIIRSTEELENIQILRKVERRVSIDPRPQQFPANPYVKQSSSLNGSNHNIHPAFNYTFKIHPVPQTNYETPELLKYIKHREVKSITKIDHSDDLIRQLSEELRKMEFKKIEDIAKGNFTFLRKK